MQKNTEKPKNEKFKMNFNMFGNPELFYIHPDLHKEFKPFKVIKSIIKYPFKVMYRVLAWKSLYAFILLFGGLSVMLWSFSTIMAMVGA